ncbi:MAG: DUF5131 family protein [Planktothrix sp.]|uniref:DUF5131 family protein n=1 Tax=Planktothrix sp. TaxID=3088171 RepID=UPI0038D40CCB
MSNIEWTGETWNPIIGCSKISAGCRNCYAINQAFRNWKMAEGLPENKRGRLAYYEGLTKGFDDWTGKLVFVPEALEIPLKRKKPQTYFVNSMSDMFHKNVEDEWLDEIFAVMALTPQHTYQILTKRPERMQEYLSNSETIERIEEAGYEFSHNMDCLNNWPFPNVWLGVSVENQKAADERIPLLLETPAAIRFLSCEPLLEFVNLSRWLPIELEESGWNRLEPLIDPLTFDWVIVGGESGRGARRCDVQWLEEITEQCLAADVAIFVKQFGSKPTGIDIKLSDKKGGDFNQFPESLQFRQMPKQLGV